ncbi:MAG: Gfo/Idh/MocA family oxidoreductase [Saprospiraceae bacterium]|nr:Gfo/Idh/MocA family oxidoreductase [Saprospiraceae bacterium]
MSLKNTRRRFIKHSIATTVPLSFGVQPVSWLTTKNPANKINVAIMGVCNRGRALANAFAAAKDCEISYICEVDSRCIADVLKDVAQYQTSVPKVEKDIRKVLEDKSIDALVIAAPDHWHAPAAIMACQAGKHVYVEKPCSHNPQEGEWLVDAAKKHKRVVQMGNQRRTWSNVQACIRDLHDGLIGNVYYANAWYVNGRPSIGYGKKTNPPAELDFDLWQGPAPRRAYQDNIHPYEWHWFWHWGTGELLNNGTHFVDLMRWGLQVDYPTYVVSTGGRFHYKDDWQTPDTQTVSINFGETKSMTWESRSCSRLPVHGQSAGVSFHGEGGSVVLESGNAYTVYDNDSKPKVIKQVTADSSKEHDQQNVYGPGLLYDIGHVENFLKAVRENGTPNSEIVGGQQSVLLCQLGNIAYRTKSGLHIDPANGHLIDNSHLNSPEAHQLWSRDYEPEWKPVV